MNFGLNSPQTNKSSEPKECFRLILKFHLDIKAEIVQKVKKLLAARFIKPIELPQWLSNIVPIKKNNGKIRCCLEMFSFNDGFSGNNQIKITQRDTTNIAFRAPIKNFYYIVMPFGFKNVGAMSQRVMTIIFHDIMHQELKDYVDNVVIKSKTRESHVEIL